MDLQMIFFFYSNQMALIWLLKLILIVSIFTLNTATIDK